MPRAQGVLLVFSSFAAFFLAAGAVGCGAAGEAPSSRTGVNSAAVAAGDPNGEARDVRAIHRSRCGSCHVRVEPGERTRAELQAAFARHRTRVKMSDVEWSHMIDYLASDPAPAAEK